MTRECRSDFVALKKYIGQYSISNNLRDDAFLEPLKNMHKYYFSMVTWDAEMQQRSGDILLAYKDCTDEMLFRISESVSDMGASLFNWMNGSYKTSRIMLRVAIENFIRSISAIEDKSQLSEKNVYSLFEKAAGMAIFSSNQVIKHAFNQLHSDYKTLCKDTHTTTAANMEQMTSLAGLPVFKKQKAENCKVIYVRVAGNISCIFCIIFADVYHEMHHRNRENILNSMSKKIRPIISGIT